MTPVLGKAIETFGLFIDFEMALNAFRELLNVTKGSPWPASPAERWPSAPKGAQAPPRANQMSIQKSELG